MSNPTDTETLPDRAELISRWKVVMRSPPPTGFSSIRLYRGIRYAEQVAADPELQRLDRQVNQRLKQLAKNPPAKRQKILSGTRLLREWHGKTYEVQVTNKGYLYQGTIYRSLSAISSMITGTQWSGPNFFGLK